MSDSDGESPRSLLMEQQEDKKKQKSKEKYGTLSQSDFREDGTLSASGFYLSSEDLVSIMDSEDLGPLKKVGGVEGLAKSLRTDLRKGILETDHQDRITAFGRNVYPEPPHETWFELFLEAFQDVAIIILSIAAFISLGAGIGSHFIEGGEENAWIEGLAIIVTVILVAVVSATNNYSKELQFRALKEKNSDRQVRVIRYGEERMISIFDVMAGEICVLHTGNKIPGDGIYIPSDEELMVDESSLTGESDHQIKNSDNPFLFAECKITRGSAHMLVTSVGESSRWGRTLALAPDDRPPTPLQDKLEDLVVIIGKFGLGVSVFVFVILVIYYLVEEPWNSPHIVPCYDGIPTNTSPPTNCSDFPSAGPGEAIIGTTFHPTSLLEILRSFIIAVTIVVVAVPEGLPLAVTISLAYSMSQMMKDQNLVRHLSACETMGGVTNICSDKTGTLTENRMSVVEGIIVEKTFERISEIGPLDEDVKKILIHSCCLNNEDGALQKTPGKPIEYLGSVTECALLVLIEKLGGDYKSLQKEHQRVKKWGFTSQRKRMSTAYQLPDCVRLYCKGASEMVLERCTRILKADGSVEDMPKKVSKQLNEHIIKMANKGLRTICLAYRDFDEIPNWSKNDDGVGFEEELTCIGIVGIEDPLRPEVPDAVATCQLAGITVRMVTGDNILTASKIAQDCGILTTGIALEGPEFSKKTDDEVDSLLPQLQVLARSSPADKFRLVTRLKETGEVVAVTGDGTNDAPALSAADVGLAMGIAGTEVAKEAADIIILDDNFASIVKSVMWGRSVFDNIRKFLQFQLTVNVVALVVAFFGAVTDYGTPLTAVQLLWVNLIMDTMAALALGTEKPKMDLLKRKPYGKEGRLITWIMWRNILGQSFFQTAVLFIILYAVDGNGNHLIFPGIKSGKEMVELHIPSVHYTMVFNTFVFLQIFNEINSRKVNLQLNVFEGIFTNSIFCGIIIFTIVVQVLLVEFGGEALETVSLNWVYWCYCVGIGYLSLPIGFILRLIPVPLEEWEKETEYIQLN